MRNSEPEPVRESKSEPDGDSDGERDREGERQRKRGTANAKERVINEKKVRQKGTQSTFRYRLQLQRVRFDEKQKM